MLLDHLGLMQIGCILLFPRLLLLDGGSWWSGDVAIV